MPPAARWATDFRQKAANKGCRLQQLPTQQAPAVISDANYKRMHDQLTATNQRQHQQAPTTHPLWSSAQADSMTGHFLQMAVSIKAQQQYQDSVGADPNQCHYPAGGHPYAPGTPDAATPASSDLYVSFGWYIYIQAINPDNQRLLIELGTAAATGVLGAYLGGYEGALAGALVGALIAHFLDYGVNDLICYDFAFSYDGNVAYVWTTASAGTNWCN